MHPLTSGELVPSSTQPRWASRFRFPLKIALLVAAALTLLGVIAPFVTVGSYRAQIEKSLQASLGRSVKLGDIHYTLFSGPGFSIENVTIGEDPRFGIEPCAYVPTLVARLRLDKLLKGSIQFAELRLSEPTLNLVKRSDGSWNILEALQRLGRHGASSWAFVPAVQISDARLNFKFGYRKTVLYLDAADIEAYPESSGKVRIRFSGLPSRSDRSGHGFGLVRGSANWYLNPPSTGTNRLEADVTLERTNLSEAITLVEGYDIGIHGDISSHLLISGPETSLNVKGDVHLQDVHRWDLLPSSGDDWYVQCRGMIDLTSHKIQLETLPADANAPSPVVLKMRVNDFLATPSWSVIAQLHQAPAQNLLPLASRMGLGLPSGLTATGSVNGAVGYSNRSGWNGGLALTQVAASLPGSPTLRAPLTTLNVVNDHVHIFPSQVEIQLGASVQVTGDYVPSSRALAVDFSLAGSPVTALNGAITSWFGDPPFFPALQNGVVSGQLHYENSPPDPTDWTGDFQLSKASLQVPGIAVPVRNLAAHVLLTSRQLNVPRFTAVVAEIPVSGEYHYNFAALRKERVQIQTTALDLADVEQALAPTLGPQDFLSRFRFGRRNPPAWLSERNLEGDAYIERVSLNGVALGALKTHFLWLGPSVQINSLQMTLPEGRLRGRGSVNLANARPRYALSGDLVNFPWKGGVLDLSGDLTTTGAGPDTLLNLRASGEFSGREIVANQDATFSSVSGKYAMSFESGWPRLQLSAVQAEQADEVWEGTGVSQKDGSLIFDLANGARQLRVLSTLDSSAGPPAPATVSSTAAH